MMNLCPWSINENEVCGHVSGSAGLTKMVVHGAVKGEKKRRYTEEEAESQY